MILTKGTPVRLDKYRMMRLWILPKLVDVGFGGFSL